MSNTPLVTVAICTYNRAGCLGLSLDAVCKQEAAFPFEVLVVDNNSTDNTKVVAESFGGGKPQVRYVLEPRQGLSHARNRALEEARAAVVAYLDDDAIARPGWLEATARAFEDPCVVCAGGRILLRYPGAKPEWLDDRMESILAAYDKGPESCDVQEVFGANFAVRRLSALELGGFSDKVGYTAGRNIGGEETDMCRRMIRAGGRVIYIPGAAVDHIVDPNRLNKKWFLRRYELNGHAAVIMREHEVWVSRELARYVVMSAGAHIHALFGRAKQSMWCAVRAAVSKGILNELYPTPLSKAKALFAVVIEAPKALFRATRPTRA
jgi:glycosyltransferase involved in cell wall biosynthesis